MKCLSVIALLLLSFVSTFAETYHIGPGKKYQNIGDAPLASLKEGDSVLIYYKDDPYHEKWVITAKGSEARPVVFHGVAESGKLPVIDGQDAITPSGMNFWSEGRGVIKIGGSNNPPDIMPSSIIIENLEIKNGSVPFSFTGRDGVTTWDENAAAIFLEKGENIIVRNCILHHCGNGFFSAHQSRNVTVEYCHIYGNGNTGSIYEHNNYTESFCITFQFNRFGPLREGAEGNNLKDRSAGCVIRYNWIESGNRQLDLVDSDYDTFINSSSYKNTFVYGNILLEPDGAGNSQIIHYGGDSDEKKRYRKGMLYLYNNTIVSTRSGNTTLLRLSSPDESADVRNNLIFVSASGNRLGIVDNDGTVQLRSNWIKSGWRVSHSNSSATVSVKDTTIEGNSPGFADLNTQDFNLVTGSACIDKGIVLADTCLKAHKVQYQYAKHQNKKPRVGNQAQDIGAIEYELLSAFGRNAVKTTVSQGFNNTSPAIYLRKSKTRQTSRYGIMLNGRSFTWEQLYKAGASNSVLSR
jgi:hypothetical protein